MNDKKLMIKSKGILNQIGLLGVIAVLCIIFTCLNSTFIAAANLMNIVRQSAVMIIVAMGVTFVMISGELNRRGCLFNRYGCIKIADIRCFNSSGNSYWSFTWCLTGII